jgi:myo-inositol-hexaphosphate 3-phosphohydrolase
VPLLTLLAALSISAAARASQPRLSATELTRLRNLCSNAAQQAFQSRWSHPTGGITLLGFTNHYDVKANRCYLLVTYRQGKVTWFDASDTQTGKTAAHIRVGSPAP